MIKDCKQQGKEIPVFPKRVFPSRLKPDKFIKNEDGTYTKVEPEGRPHK